VPRGARGLAAAGRSGERAGGVRSYRHFRKRGTDSISECGVEWLTISTKRQCVRAANAQAESYPLVRAVLGVPLAPSLLWGQPEAPGSRPPLCPGPPGALRRP
jgi:hypothetical protein